MDHSYQFLITHAWLSPLHQNFLFHPRHVYTYAMSQTEETITMHIAALF